MIKIRYPTRRGDKTLSLELKEGIKEVDKTMEIGYFVAVNRKEDRIVIQESKEILDGDEILVFPIVSGGCHGLLTCVEK